MWVRVPPGSLKIIVMKKFKSFEDLKRDQLFPLKGRKLTEEQKIKNHKDLEEFIELLIKNKKNEKE